MPLSLPFCNVDLTPKWSYDFMKAASLNCPGASNDASGLSAGGLVGIVLSSIAFVALLSFIGVMIRQERRGKPLFLLEEPISSAAAEQA